MTTEVVALKRELNSLVTALQAKHGEQKAAKTDGSEAWAAEFQQRKEEILALRQKLTQAEAKEASAAEREEFLAGSVADLPAGPRRTAEDLVAEFDGDNPIENGSGITAARRKRRPLPLNEPQARALNAFVRSAGRLELLSQQDRQVLAAAHSTLPGSSGGYLLPPAVSTRFLELLEDATYFYGLASVEQVSSSDSLGVVGMASDDLEPEWTPEIGTVPQGTIAFDAREMRAHQLAKEVLVTEAFLQLVPNALNYILSRLAYKTAVAQEKAFLTGDGVKKPLGIFTASSDGIATSSDVSTGNTTTAVTYSGLLRWRNSLPPTYRGRATIVAGTDFIVDLLTLTDSQSRPLFLPGLADGEPDRFLGIPVKESAFAPNSHTAGSYLAVMGDFSFYQIATFLGGQTLTPHGLDIRNGKMGWILKSWLDGQPLLTQAFRRLQLAAS